MFTAAIVTSITSGLLGAFSAWLPKQMDLKDKRMMLEQENKVREFEERMRIREMDHQLAMKGMETQAKIEDSYYTAVAEVDRGAREHAEELFSQLTKPTGSAWADSANAWMRPIINYTMTAMFTIALLCWMFGFGAVNAEFGKALGVAFIELLNGIWFFIYGARQVNKPGSILPFGK